MKKILFMGTPAFSAKVLQALLDKNYEVIGVFTQPDRKVGRKNILTPSPVKSLALQHQLPVYQPEKLSGSQEMADIMSQDFDLIVTAAYGQFLPTKLLKHPAFGAVNVHASLLPKYRGGAPIHYAIMNGEKETGVTIMRMVAKMDAGNILTQRATPIGPKEDVADLFDRLADIGADLLLETLPQVFDGTITEIPQDETQVSFSPNILPHQEQIDWEKDAQAIDCFIRGLRPWPTSFTLLKGQRFKIWQAMPVHKTSDLAPGSLFQSSGKLYVACGQGTVLLLEEVQPAGKAKMSASAFLNGLGKEGLEGLVFEGIHHG